MNHAFADVRYTGKSLRDPFIDISSNNNTSIESDKLAARIQAMRLEGILYSAESPHAIINGKILSVGDRLVGPARILRIEKSVVIVSTGGKEIILKYTPRKTDEPKNQKNEQNEPNE